MLKYLNLVLPAALHQSWFKIPILGTMGVENLSLSEPWMIRLLNYVLPLKSGCFVDVGVNVGQTLIKFRSVDRERPYYGFEPNPACIVYTQRLIQCNRFANTTLIPVGISASGGLTQLHFFCDNPSDSSASIVPNFRPGGQVFTSSYVPCYTFASLRQVLGHHQVGLIKIDIEGAESEVLVGMSELLQSNRPLVILEILPVYTSENLARLSRQQIIEELIRSLEYRIFRIQKRPFGLEPLVEFGIHGQDDWCDYLLLPAEIDLPPLNCPTGS